MGTILIIPKVNKKQKSETILFPENDLYYLIKEYLGDEIAGIYEEILEELEGYREKDERLQS